MCFIQPIHKYSISFLHRARLFPSVACRFFFTERGGSLPHALPRLRIRARAKEQQCAHVDVQEQGLVSPKRRVFMSLESVAEAFCVDPQFEICDKLAEEKFVGDSVPSIGSPGPIDVVSSEGTHHLVDGGASAHESIVLRTRSSGCAYPDSGADKSPCAPPQKVSITCSAARFWSKRRR